MKRRIIQGRKAVAFAVLIAVIAAVFAGAKILERAQQSAREKELQAERERLKPSQWANDNTLVLEGERYGYDHRIETFLFIGTDNSGNSNPEEYRGRMADFLLLMILDHTENTIAYLQIDRNTVTDVREVDWSGEEIATRELQICTAHWYGRSPEMAAENTVYAVRNYLGGLEHIDGYFEMNIEDIGRLNHSVGGVTVTINDDLDAADPAMTRGKTMELDDRQAEIFLRSRMNVGEGTNVERMARQRQYMTSFFEKVRTETLKNPKFGTELWEMLKDAAVTNMNGNDFSRIAQKLLKGTNKGMHTIGGQTVLGEILQDGQVHEEFYTDKTSRREELINLLSLKHIDDAE